MRAQLAVLHDIAERLGVDLEHPTAKGRRWAAVSAHLAQDQGRQLMDAIDDAVGAGLHCSLYRSGRAGRYFWLYVQVELAEVELPEAVI